MITPRDSLSRFTEILASVSSLDSLRERFCEAGRLMLDADGVVVTSETVPDGPVTVASTGPLSDRLEQLQRSNGEGPLIESLRTGTVVVGDFGRTTDIRWPALDRCLREIPFSGSLIAVPLHSELTLKGVLLAHRETGPPWTEDADVRFLGNAIGTAVLQDPSIGAQGHVFAEILADRDLVHRATGLLETEAGIHYEDALALLRALAFSRGDDLGDVARTVVDGTLSLSQDADNGQDISRPWPDRG